MKNLLTLFILLSNIVFSQSNVWVKIPNFNSYSITKENGVISSNSSELNRIISSYSVTNIFKAVPSSKNPQLINLYQLDCNCNPEDLVKDISRGFDIFEGPQIGPSYGSLSEPNDYYPSGVSNYALDIINAPGAWEEGQGNLVTIAITDANYYLNHEDLNGKYDYVSPANSNTNYAHGTAVAITAGGNTNNGIGISSIGYDSRLQLRAMTYNEILSASYSGAKVINCSWSSGCYFNPYAQDIINEVYDNGSIVIASAGNGSTCGGSSNLVYPASYDHVISVTSIGLNKNHERIIGDPNSTHQHNSMVDISAPGYDVLVSTAPGVYSAANGTSFASPFVSGTVALMLSVNPCLTFEQIEYILKKTSDSTIYLNNPQYQNGLGSGLLNSHLAVKMAKNYNTISGQFKSSVDCSTGEKTVTVLNLNGVSPYSYSWNTGEISSSVTIDTDRNLLVRIVDSLGCVFIDSVYEVKYNRISADLTVKNLTCFGHNDGKIYVDVTGGFSTQSPIWENGTIGNSLSNLHSGEYTFTVIDGYDCEFKDTVYVGEPQKLLSEIEFISPTPNSLGSINLSVTGGTLPYTYEWNTGDTTEDLFNLYSGFYEVLVSDSNGCLVSSNKNLEETQNLSIEENIKGEFIIYPNPSEGRVTIKNNKEISSTLTVTDLNGKNLISEKVFLNQIELNDLSTGIYLIKVDGKTQKLIIK